jgi:hypothetical protein
MIVGTTGVTDSKVVASFVAHFLMDCANSASPINPFSLAT